MYPHLISVNYKTVWWSTLWITGAYFYHHRSSEKYGREELNKINLCLHLKINTIYYRGMQAGKMGVPWSTPYHLFLLAKLGCTLGKAVLQY